MKKNIRISIYIIFVMGLLLILADSCKKELSSPSSEYDLRKANITFQGPIVNDIDGNIYHTVKIGTQWWMVENLKVTHYRNGEAIPKLALPDLNGVSSGVYGNYNYDASISKTYGRLYNWYAVNDNRKIAPLGWHVATDAEWTTLTNYLGGTNIAGGKLKETGTAHWLAPNTGASNGSGFTALPAGLRLYAPNTTFSSIGRQGLWWTSTSFSGYSICWYINYSSGNVTRQQDTERITLLSVRCVKD